MRKTFILVIIMTMALHLFPQVRVEEKVDINWWVLPVFAVNDSGEPVTDLTNRDIELRVNNAEIKDFSLFKRSFTVQKGEEKPMPPAIQRKRVVFLVFDTVMSSREHFNRCKGIAMDMVNKAEKGTLFTVMTVDPFAGPLYHGGPIADKKEVARIIEEKVTWDANAKNWKSIFSLVASFQQGGTIKEGVKKSKAGPSGLIKYSSSDLGFFREEISARLQNSDDKFFLSFETLYYSLNSIKDNKFLYLFSEGLAMYARRALRHSENEYFDKLNRVAEYLGKSGIVLFIINPAGVTTASTSMASGEDTLRFLARQSGGKYMEGDRENIGRKIESINRSYYELAFAEEGHLQNKSAMVDVLSLRKGVQIHSLRKMEKSREYGEMNDLEKELLVLNLINPNPLYNCPLESKKLQVEKFKEKSNHYIYNIKVPEDFVDRSPDLYKIWSDNKNNQVEVEKERIAIRKRQLEIKVNKKEGKQSRIVLINAHRKIALVQGVFNLKEEKKAALAKSETQFRKNVQKMSQDEKQELSRILKGSAEYCRKLEKSILHYVCKETIAEVIEVLRSHKADKENRDSSSTGMTYGLHQGEGNVKVVKRKVTKKYLFDYQLIQRNGQINEQRKFLGGTQSESSKSQKAIHLDSFISRKIAMAPLSILGAWAQSKFDYRIVKYEKIKGVRTAVIECFPKNSAMIKANYGKIWVDLKDYSIVRLSLNPVSIGGYPQLLKLAANFKAKLTLTCRINFYKSHNGIRFPSGVLISEKYAGGPNLRKIVGVNVWERSKTVYDYKDYKFFNVGVTSQAEAIK